MAGKGTPLPKPKPEDRHNVMRGIQMGIILCVTYLSVMYFVVPLPMPKLTTLTDKLVLTLRLQTFSVLTFVFGLVKVMGIRRTSAAMDPIAGKAEHLLAVNHRYTANTLEQLVVSVPGQLILTTYLSEPQMKIIPILVSLFVMGRIAFYIGYTILPSKRALGFFCTYAPSVAVWVFIVFKLVSDFVPFITK